MVRHNVDRDLTSKQVFDQSKVRFVGAPVTMHAACDNHPRRFFVILPIHLYEKARISRGRNAVCELR